MTKNKTSKTKNKNKNKQTILIHLICIIEYDLENTLQFTITFRLFCDLYRRPISVWRHTSGLRLRWMDFGRSESREVNWCLVEMKLLTEIPKAPRTKEISADIKSLWNIVNILLKFRQLITVEVQCFATSDIWQCGMCSLSHMVTWSSNSLITVEALRHLTVRVCSLYHMVTVWRGALGFRVSVIRTTIAGSISFYKISKIIQYFTEQTLKGCSWKRPDGEDYWW